MDQDLPYFYADNFSRDLRVLDEMFFGRSVIAGSFMSHNQLSLKVRMTEPMSQWVILKFGETMTRWNVSFIFLRNHLIIVCVWTFLMLDRYQSQSHKTVNNTKNTAVRCNDYSILLSRVNHFQIPGF